VLSRRRFLRLGLGATAAAALTGLYSWRLEPHWLQIVRRPLPIAGLPEALVGRSLVQISDVHVGGWMDDAYVIAAFDRVRRMAPDLVAWTGDQVSFRRGDPLRRLERAMRHAPRGRIGAVAVLGNHDYGHGQRWAAYHEEHALAIADSLAGAGATLLRNASTTIEGLTFVGLDDLWSGRLDVARAFEGVPPGAPALHLCHNPDGADVAGWGDRRGWILAGHTHGGQVKLPFLPPPVLLVDNQRYVSGEVDAGGGRRLYISRGLGYVVPVRLGVRPEVTWFTLARA
jgi:hypothetical protein